MRRTAGRITIVAEADAELGANIFHRRGGSVIHPEIVLLSCLTCLLILAEQHVPYSSSA